ncbi:hypothetical protein HMPREF9099_01957 [Lachnospiraceae bacterium oral taxon 082 str. F0431]|nr:hypothetical protein HMPREF9099_01957 [Lachnospiraceae bacterium oral taxon 082 str. F0431]
MNGVIIAAAVVGIVGILIGLLLGVASEKFKVEVDEKEIAVREASRETTVAVAVIRVATVLQRLLRQVRPL